MRHAALLPTIGLCLACGSGPAKPPSPFHGDESVEHHAPPCDPFSSTEPAPAPLAKAVCGNGIVEETAGTCVKRCAGGCDRPVECRTECTRPRESCDGRDVPVTCASLGYAGGEVSCSPACEVVDSGCLACVAEAGVRCATAPLAGDEVHVVGAGKTAAVFAREELTGRISGVKVTATLQTSPLADLPTGTLAAGALGGGLGYVDARHRFGVVEASSGRAQLRGPVMADAGDATRILIARETFRSAGAAVLSGDHQRRTLALFDPPSATEPRHFYLQNVRIFVIPGAHELARGVTRNGAELAVIAFGNEVFAYERDGFELKRLPAVPAGVTFSFTYPSYTDAIRWPSGQLVTRRSTDPGTSSPPAGLSRAALSGASMAAAFEGVLMARRRAEGTRSRVELYWRSAPDPLAPATP